MTEPVKQFANYQYEVYLRGMAGEVPELPVFPAALEARAEETMSPEGFGYVAAGAGSEATVRANREAFERWRLVPRMLRGIPANRTHTTTVLGTTMPAPVMLAPVGVLSIVHPEAEKGVARAEAAGYEALVVTLDTWQLGWRPRDLSTAYLPFLQAEGVANYFADPVFRAGLEKAPEEDSGPAVLKFVGLFNNPTLTWDDLAFLRANTSLPIVLKGILHPDDARLAVEHGMDGVLVSNPGGRQVDGAIAARDALPGVVDAVPEDFPVLFESGVRSAADAMKAIMLGARAVLLGRPYLWGLGIAGEDGVRQVLRGFLAELDLTLALTGHTSLAEVGREDLMSSVPPTGR